MVYDVDALFNSHLVSKAPAPASYTELEPSSYLMREQDLALWADQNSPERPLAKASCSFLNSNRAFEVY